MPTFVLILHSLIAVALLGAITHQSLATFAPPHARPGSFWGRFRGVSAAAFANGIVVLYAVSALLGAIVYLNFRTDIQPLLERGGQWKFLGLFDIKEHFISIGLGLLPAYWVCWRQSRAPDEPSPTRTVLTATLAFIVWWSFLIGHVLNNTRGFGG